ncbi:MAG: prepilin-type N-terminal cleavage/methylation domain-containing protein [Ezakiella sp.]|nr:prepilin-type N-terminal cleavage/methylation domain-containing protein [Ezakiella sp.]MDD7471868.1 prepilin-type N-terminal cleavage/methylation domain-containing protein [Bacillota bacterium]MDY3923832.1 prepilin-type N-terminal cleavage/methylation domain-containing protein [Ezakiella sp.]
MNLLSIKNRKNRAFTLLEVIIVLIIISILFVSYFNFGGSIFKNLTKYKSNEDSMSNISLVGSYIRKFASRADLVFINKYSNGNLIFRRKEDGRDVFYSFLLEDRKVYYCVYDIKDDAPDTWKKIYSDSPTKNEISNNVELLSISIEDDTLKIEVGDEKEIYTDFVRVFCYEED